MQEYLELLRTELYDDGSYTEYWQSSYDTGYAKTYSSNNMLIFMETIAANESGLKTIVLNKYCYRDNLDNVTFPSTIYEPSVPEWKYGVHTIDSLNRCVLIEHYDIPPSDELLGKTIINYFEDGHRTEFYIDYSSYGVSSTQTVYDSNDRIISEVEYFDPDAQNKARVITFEYSEDNCVKTTTLNYHQTEIDLHNIRARQTIENSLTGYSKEINYTDYEMTQIRDITEFQTKEDGSKEEVYIVYNSNVDDDFSYKQISTPDGRYTKKEWFYDPKLTQLCSIDEIEQDEDGQTRIWDNKKYSKEGELISVTKQEFAKDGNLINFEAECYTDTKDIRTMDAYFESADKIVSQLIEEKYREYILKKLKTFYIMTSQALGQDEDLGITVEKQEFGAQCVTEWTFDVAQKCIKAKIPDEYLDTILQNTAMTVYEVLRQTLSNKDETPINLTLVDLISSFAERYVKQLCKKLFKDLKDNKKITKECYKNALKEFNIEQTRS